MYTKKYGIAFFPRFLFIFSFSSGSKKIHPAFKRQPIDIFSWLYNVIIFNKSKSVYEISLFWL